MFYDEQRLKEIAHVYNRFRDTLGEHANDAVKLTELYFAQDAVEELRSIALQISKSELEKQEFYEWRKKDPHAITKPPLAR